LAARLDRVGVAALAGALGRVIAPFAGIVTRRLAALGDQVAARQTLLELDALRQVYIDVGVPASQRAAWAGGDTEARVDGRWITLQALATGARLDPGTGLWLLRFRAAAPDGRLQDGAWVRIRHQGPPRPVTWVPAAAVVSRDEHDWVVPGPAFKPVEVDTGPVAEDGRVPVLIRFVD
jgi:multidrug efflux pump subunit AcrA (membrane-fusion protein)